ncbi:RNA polymerase sigma factor [Pseudochryseolinea flava]|uniref:RNA polymerase subunit sigma n=1 Tax=Pseudochryseolinea flava TaxID=2059302 RepID=A0A364Y812_9BACT|nr:sigma-70 family RNA polymerase sigma factor [Pseudochryseolinea flava]RAW02391.1 RNA polymerase subunit sigma [Pseudochryseolinea flava]
MKQDQLIPNLFRTEYSKIVAVLCKHFGVTFIDHAEDIASDSFLKAMQTWPFEGIPEKPTAWLYTVAKNKAFNLLLRRQTYEANVLTAWTDMNDCSITLDLSEDNIQDSQLRMIFAICHPTLPKESQIALALRILCGFGIDEIATAFLTSRDTINKRLSRAKDKFRNANVTLEFPEGNTLITRLDAVLITLYLLFSEGYYSENNERLVNEEFCFEAMRLAHLLTLSNETCRPETNALLALMCFQASRLKARTDHSGALIFYEEQDTTLWDMALIAEGTRYLHEASTGNTVSRYHLEAAIAYWYTRKENAEEKWQNILTLYDQLLTVEYSPIAAMNRTFALAQVKGNATAIVEAEKLKLEENLFYFVLLGELYRPLDGEKAKLHFERALTLAKTQRDRQSIQRKLNGVVAS